MAWISGAIPRYLRERVGQYDPRVRPWYRKAKAQGRAAWSEIYLDFSSQLPTITASLPVYNNKMGNQLVGVCGTDLLLSEELRQFLQSLQIGRSGEAFVVDRAGVLISSSMDETVSVGLTGLIAKDSEALKAFESRHPLVRDTAQYLNQRFGKLNQIETAQQLNFKLAGEPQFLEVLPFGDRYGLDWLIVLVVPEIDFMQEVLCQYPPDYPALFVSPGPDYSDRHPL
ncbi:MAG: hypothetical protein HC825_04340, partial [Oscillatoriales cyanobacterium RM1_1_9]|nr:hypothetical protein [Oscillatoriales cyanobacterium RM1_1_9]